MAITVNYNSNNCGIKGVYSQDLLRMTESNTTTTYFKVLLYQEGSLYRTLQLPADINYSASLDINRIYQDLFESDVKLNTDLIKVYYTINSYNSSDTLISTISNSSNYNRILNGIKSDYNNYIINPTNNAILSTYNASPKFLNDERLSSIYFDNTLYANAGEYALPTHKLSYIKADNLRDVGIGTVSNINILTIKLYKKDNTITELTYTVPTQTGTDIFTIDIDPITLNLGAYDLSSYYKYTIQDETNKSELYTVYIKQPDQRNDKYFRVNWLNTNGVPTYFNFDYNYQKKLNIKRIEYSRIGDDEREYKASYNTDKEVIYNVTTNWITEEESTILETLWTSPSVKVDTLYNNLDSYYKDKVDGKLIKDEYIILDVKSVDIKRKRNTKLINYSFNFTLSTQYNVQKH